MLKAFAVLKFVLKLQRNAKLLMLMRACAARKKQPAVRFAANPPQNGVQIRIQKCKIIFTGNAGEYLLHNSIFRRFDVKSDSKPATKQDTKGKKERGFAFAKPLTWCGKRDLNPYVKYTRPSNVPVCRFQHCRISNARFIITTILYKVKGFSDVL